MFLFLFKFFIVDNFVERIESIVPDSSPYLTGLGLIFGVGSFGTEGVLIGPLLILLLKTTFQLFVENVTSPNMLTAKDIEYLESSYVLSEKST